MAKSNMSAGEKIRRKVMGSEFVDASLEKASDFDMPLQESAMEHAWGAAWVRDGLDIKTRSIMTVSMLIAMREQEELKGHLRGAVTNAVTLEELREIIMHSAAYCGYPAALSAMSIAKEVLKID